MSRHLVSLMLLACAALAFAAPEKLLPANLSVDVYQRIIPPQKKASVSLGTFNLRTATVRIYPTTIEQLIPNAAVLEASNDRTNPNSVVGRLAKMTLGAPTETRKVEVKDYYPNSWRGCEVKLPALSSGVYVIEAAGGGVTKRTWVAISQDALLVKRSQDVITAWLINTVTGKPRAGVPLVLYDAKGRSQMVKTAADGLATFPTPTAFGPLWVAAQSREPAFARASAPLQEKPYQTYLYTDRPIYRPGQTVNFRGTVRAVSRGAYSLPKNREVRVQIKTRGDTLVLDERLPLNAWGSFSGQFHLAPEPPLGQYTLEMAIGDYREYAGFEVASYRTPDFDVTVDTPAPHLVANGQQIPVTISAKYFFGSPLARAKVAYYIDFSEDGGFVPQEIRTAAGLGSDALRYGEDAVSGQGVLDSDGKLVVMAPTVRVPYNRQMMVRATVTDLSQRSRTGSGDMSLTAAAFRLALRPEKAQYQPGETAKVLVTATDYDDKPVATSVTVNMIEDLIDREGRSYQQRTQRTVATDGDGRGYVSFPLIRPGSYELQAWALDADNNPVYTDGYCYASAQQTRQPAWPTLELDLDREQYAPGDTAKLRIRTDMLGASALLTVEGERLYLARVVPLAKNDFTVTLPVVPEYLRGVTLRLTAIRQGDTYNAYAGLDVPDTDHKLRVTVTADKPGYQPGETATFTVRTTDAQGTPIPAEVALGVVDTALYALREDDTADPYDAFWFEQHNRVETDFSLAAAYPGGAFQHIPAPAPGFLFDRETGGEARVRQQFADTAYWASSLLTDADGTATLSFVMPDNLTTWRTTTRALTRETAAGQTQNETRATLPLMVRMTLPRFCVRDDRTAVTALIHNYTGTERTVRATLTAEGAQIEGEPSYSIHIPANEIRRVSWNVMVTGLTGADTDTVRFQVSADGGADAQDAMQSTIPVHPRGVWRVETEAGAIAQPADHTQPPSGGIETVTIHLSLDAVPGSAQLEVALSPSLAGPIFEALDYLVGYPHGGAEQTMERFLPDMIVARTLRALGVDRPEPPMLQRYADFGIQKLLRYQHDDGGWQWWEHDESDPYMTAYIAYGLAMARDAGYPLAAGPLPRAVSYLTERIGDIQTLGPATPAERAYLLWALTYAADGDVDAQQQATRMARRLIQEQPQLDTFSQASLALTLDRLSRQQGAPADLAPAAQKIAAELEQAAVVTGAGAHWTTHAGGYGDWLDNDVEVTAQVLQALLAVRPQSAQIVPAVRWLMAARRGAAWNSTKDTAAAVLALSAYLQQAQELAPDGLVTLRINGREVTRYEVQAADAFAPAVQILIPAAELQPGENTLHIEHAGAGNLYWHARMRYVLPVEKTEPLARGITLTRTFHVSAADPVAAGQQRIGNMMRVELHINADHAFRYVQIEEPIPAGCEIAGDGAADNPHCYTQVRDNRRTFYLDQLPKGETMLTYWLRIESSGSFAIPPSIAALTYFPEVRGDGPAAHLQVVVE